MLRCSRVNVLRVAVDRSLVFDARKKGKRPRTHVLIVGVSWYPHLPGGGKKVVENADGLGQLTSPSVSARELASWFLDHFDGDRPLGTLRLLTSEKTPGLFKHAKLAKAKTPARATVDQIKEAVDAWVEAGDKHAGNLMVFYFCGHGLGNEQAMSLLPQDFGAKRGEAFATAINFHAFKRGMRRCKALNQAFFVDACRSNSDLLDENFGRTLLENPGTSPGDLQQPVFWSTKLGAKSQAEAKKPSFFTQALISALGGLGADFNAGTWRVTTNKLAEALPFEMRRAKRGQLPPADDLTPFVLNNLADDPEIPVSVICMPKAAHKKTTLSCELGNQVVQRKPAPIPDRWEVSLRAVPESYAFRAAPNGAPFIEAMETIAIRPPGQDIQLVLNPKKKDP
jgi:hypothetical protein